MGLNINNERSNEKNKNNELIYKTKDQVKNQISKSIFVKQAWIPKCLFTILDTMENMNKTKQVWVPKSSIFMQECLTVMHNRWYLDSGSSRHMTGDKSKFCLLTESDCGKVTFGRNSKGKIIGSQKIGKNLSSYIDDVMLIEGLTYNLLSISQ